jgi:hypothetical protein
MSEDPPLVGGAVDDEKVGLPLKLAQLTGGTGEVAGLDDPMV